MHEWLEGFYYMLALNGKGAGNLFPVLNLRSSPPITCIYLHGCSRVAVAMSREQLEKERTDFWATRVTGIPEVQKPGAPT